MTVNRRQFLGGAAVAATATTLGLSACSGGDSGSSDGSASISLGWWGNDVRNKQTNEAIAAYQKTNPKVSIKAQPGEWSSYWDKLSTQTAGKNAPDMIQMDMAYISEYADNGVLLDLKKYGVDTSKFTEGTAAPGILDDKLVGVNAGVNSLTLLANPDVFKKAGVDLPDDMTWTWDDYIEIAAELQAKGPKGTTGTASSFGSDNLLQIWLRQNGADTFSANGLGFTADQLGEYLNLMVKFKTKKAIPNASAINEEVGKSLDQTAFAKGTQGFCLFWSNQLAAINEASGTSMKMLRPPTVAGDAKQRNAWYKASMLWSGYAGSKDPEAVGKLINWWVNDKACADICLDERGVPANGDMVTEVTPKLTASGKTSVKYLDDIKPELGKNPVAPPPGGSEMGDILMRHTNDILFGKDQVPSAAKKIIDELNTALKG
ncbi:ABC transporter substrate-binding protein [Microlunatus soli]|uniref:Carbohydrate ABC transporter substrate-binding protein, CUT1 family n=1 Tax=Microlunatus soli TaxID=630515 RepID=A0A1H1YUH1_9ACTN|nr:extracellular solute-binding protein [Microlunatus soli]SDT24666.1 carbohydrate ABC transporter substrate-binding protein, CUT1 family [Microlunatus soli]